MKPLSNYKFYITLPTGVEQEIKVNNDELNYKFEQYKEQCFKRTELTNELQLCDKELFVMLYEIERIYCNCNTLDLRIERRSCKGDDFVDYYKGKLAFVDGTWNLDDCELSITPRLVDAYTEMLDNWDKERNFLEITDRVSVGTFFGDLVCETLSTSNTPSGSGWVLKNSLVRTRDGFIVFQRHIWCRLESSTAPPDPTGWTQEGAVFVSSPILINCVNFENTDDGDVDPSTGNAFNVIVEKGFDCEVIDFKSDGGITFQSFLEYYFLEYFDSVCSNFFNINPDGSAPDNNYYQCAANDLQQLIVFQTFDIVVPGDQGAAVISGSENQVAGVKSLKKAWEDLVRMFDLCMEYDPDFNCIRIEHSSYFDGGGKVYDFERDFPNCIEHEYTIADEDIPRFQKLTYQYKTAQRDFNEGYIEYSADCSNSDPDSNVDTETIECFLNDVSSIYNYEDLRYNEAVTDNITLLSTTDGVINSAVGDLTGANILNGQLSTANLLAKYHLSNRPQCSGLLNGKQQTFISQKPIRKVKKFSMFVHSSYFDALNLNRDKVKLKWFGDCQILSVERSEPDCYTSFVVGF